ncbi:reverse transcriptase domain, reverse transcriptase zinc-binding domain protein [Tanacetum coccineum]
MKRGKAKDIPVKSDSSYEWRKILQIRNVVRPFFFHDVGKGDRTSAWFDKWLDEGPLDAIVSRRDMHPGGFNTDSVVRDLIHDNAWAWPAEWLGKYDILNSLNPILLNNKEDKLWWKHIDGSTQNFTVANVWNSIRPRSNKVDWFDVVWFPQSIPRHSFLVWLLIGEHLKTQDKLKAWEVESSVNIDNLKCTLCRRVQDSHSHAHLFFECGFSLQVWSKAKALIHIPSVENSWRSFVMAIKPIA